MVWFLERDTEFVVCEIRHTDAADEAAFELAITGPRDEEQVERFQQPRALIERWLQCQTHLRACGWRPSRLPTGTPRIP